MKFGRYEFVKAKNRLSGSSNKFWTCIPIGNGQVRITWGKIGTSGQNQIKTTNEGLKKIREKISKGYKLTEPFESKPQNPERENQAPKKDNNGLTPFQVALRDLK